LAAGARTLGAPRSVNTQIVWFKRDLRVHDHEALARAAEAGPVIALFVYEPSVLQAPESSTCHLLFVNDCLAELRNELARRGCPLLLRVGECPQMFADIDREFGFEAIWSHEETGLEVTYARDRRMAVWCKENGKAWHEIPQNGVVRRLKSRNGWARQWDARMSRARLPAPPHITTVPSLRDLITLSKVEPLRDGVSLGVRGQPKPEVWAGGESIAERTLQSFLNERGRQYRVEMSSPVSAFEACSRLSPYLAWGAISMRTVHQACERRRAELRVARDVGIPVDRAWFGSLQSFSGRLRWHCHFMQKLEDEPRIEFENFSRAYDGLRESQFDTGRFEAWCRGETGYPMVDACMRALHAGGWINFRMRAMLVSFASYHLWLHWRATAQYLAQHFVDFEPGIHFSQFQMQSGTTGINTVRIYSPIKQALDHDPEGRFIRRYVPELTPVPTEYLAEPHTMPVRLQQRIGLVIGKHYPAPCVDHATAYRESRERIAALRRTPDARAEADHVQAKHGSRRSGLPQTDLSKTASRRKRPSSKQMSLLPND
jgi:deoxyribodipyrimidine photo-lyase